jgi:CheY-like chemotaxis protein
MTTLVVVDDESLVTEILSFLLGNEGYVVHCASNGREALDVAARVRPDIVVTDLMMPVMSGVEFARALRERDEFRAVPIILCSAVPDAVADADRPLFSAVLQKPYAPARLIGLIAQIAPTENAAPNGRSSEGEG